MSVKFILVSLLLTSPSVFAADPVLNCEVHDVHNYTGQHPADKASLKIVDDSIGVITQRDFKDGAFGCKVAYSLRGPDKYLSIRLFRKDMMIAESVDRAFTSDKVVNIQVNQMDMTPTNNALYIKGDESFGTGSCECKSF